MSRGDRKKNSRPRRLVVLVTLAAMLGSLVFMQPAPAAVTENLAWGTSNVFPIAGFITFDPRPDASQSVCTQVYPIPMAEPRLTQGFTWDSPARMSGFYADGTGSDVSYEHEANFRDENPGDYYFSTPGTNIPNYYQDTDLDDGPTQFTRAGGSYAARNLTHNVLYMYQLQLAKCGEEQVAQQMRVKAQLSYHNGPCLLGHANCVTGYPGWPRDLVPYSANLMTSPTEPRTYSYSTNRVQNPGFNSAFTPWAITGAPGGAGQWLRTPGGIDGSHMLMFNCMDTVAGCAIYQELGSHNFEASDRFDVSVHLRCQSWWPNSSNPIGPGCSAGVGLYNMGTTEGIYRTVSMFDQESTYPTGYWTRLEFTGKDWANTSPANLRLAIFNLSAASNVNIEVDMVTVHWTDNL